MVEEPNDDVKDMMDAGRFLITVMNNKDIPTRTELLKQNLGAITLLTEIDVSEKKRILQEVLMKLMEMDKGKKVAPRTFPTLSELKYIG